MDRHQEIQKLTTTFISAMGLTLSSAVTETEDTFRVDLTGPDAYLLLERKGAALEALQLILGKVAERQLDLDKRLVVDCDGYRQGRDKELIEIARRAAEKVRRLRQPLGLAPMNPYERRLVHLALGEEQGVTTHSEGDGFMKSIIVSPA